MLRQVFVSAVDIAAAAAFIHDSELISVVSLDVHAVVLNTFHSLLTYHRSYSLIIIIIEILIDQNVPSVNLL